MIKGHAKIELTNVKTGEMQVIEEDNMVTKAVEKMISEDVFNNVIPETGFRRWFSATEDRSIVERLFGGILLFDAEITENVNTLFPQAGVNMIGNGTPHVSSTVTKEFGSYNEQESGITVGEEESSFKFVYDFGTSQGNGQIASVCLANMLSGFVGFGNRDNLYDVNAYGGHQLYNEEDVFYTNIGRRKPVGIGQRTISGSIMNIAGIPLFCNGSKNFIGYIDKMQFINNSTYSDFFIGNTKKLKIVKKYFPFTKCNPILQFSNYYETSGSTVYDYPNITIDTIELDVPSQLQNLNVNVWSYVNCFSNGESGFLVVPSVANSYIQENATFYVWEIDVDTLETVAVYTMTNTTGRTIPCLENISSDGAQLYSSMTVLDGYLYARASLNNRWYIYKINLSDSTDVTSVYEDGENPGQIQWFNLVLLNKRVYFGIKYLNYNNPILGIIDPVLNNSKPSNHHFYGASYKLGVFVVPIKDCPDKFITGNLTNSTVRVNNYFILWQNPYTISTINNLETPVVKTADMTMKITYTLTCSNY